MIHDLTKGSESKGIILFAIPLLLSSLLQQMYTVSNSFIVGRFLGTDALAAIGISGAVIFLIIALMIGVTIGSNVVIGQAFGAKDYAKLKNAVSTSYLFFLIIGVVLTIVGLLVTPTVLHILQTPPEIFNDAYNYLFITFIGILPLTFYNGLTSVLRGFGDSQSPLIFLVFSTIINVLLDILFIVVLHFGIASTAWASVIAQCFSVVACMIILRRRMKQLDIHITQWKIDPAILQAIMKIGIPSGLQQVIVATSFIAVVRVVDSFDTATIAAYAVASRLDSFGYLPALSISMAITGFTAQNIGANKIERVKHGLNFSLFLGALFSIATAIIFNVWGKELMWLFNPGDQAVIDIGAQYLGTVSTFYILFSTMFIYAGVIRGAGEAIFPLILTAAVLWGVRVPFASIFSSAHLLGVSAIWWSMPVGWFLGSLGGFLYYISGRWKNKAVIKQSV